MELLTYSSNRYSELNEARRELWCAKDMISEANQNPERYDRSFWFGRMNKARANLRKVARKVRATLPPKKCYSITMAASTMTAETKLWANSEHDATMMARLQYGDRFSVAEVRSV